MLTRERGRACCRKLLVILSATLLVSARSTWSWPGQDPDVDAWWNLVRHEPLAAGVCTSGEDLCDRGAPNNVCRCDAECGRYGDCCVDRSDAAAGGDVPAVSPSPWRCVFESGREFYALASCPNDPAVDPDLLNHCLGRGDQLKPLQYVPVYSNASKIMYANVFCAACHKDLEALRAWQLELRCNRAWQAATVLEHLARGRYGKTSHALRGSKGLTCKLQIADAASQGFWYEVPELRECRIASSTCRKNASPRDVLLCSSYTAHVYSPRRFSNYRNFHCFRCAGGSASTVECGARPAAYANDAPNLVSRLVMGVRSHFVSPRRCPNTETHIYDPISDKCYKSPVSVSELAAERPSGGTGAPVRTRVLRLVFVVATAALSAIL